MFHDFSPIVRRVACERFGARVPVRFGAAAGYGCRVPTQGAAVVSATTS